MNKKKIYGTTIYIGSNEIETIYGKFKAMTYQNLINKHYIIAILIGDIKEKTLYTRVHSSCVTSETLCSMDCDCVEQLNGAFKKISEKGNGILFYLIQEGRGCGYVGKSRACMNIQYTHDLTTTFEAYKHLGMKSDYRTYNNIYDIYQMLELNCEFILLTNNPDKINGLINENIKIKDVESIEYEPNPFNQAYLISKMQTGHILHDVKKKIDTLELPYVPIEPFEPYHVNNMKRFIHVASYYLPIQPVDDLIILNKQEIDNLNSIDKSIYNNIIPLPEEDKYFVKLPNQELYNLDSSLSKKPYWFKVSVYYDVITHTDYIVLEYNDCKKDGTTPIVRIHSESIFNRFPLKEPIYKNIFKDTLKMIIKNGCGLIILFYNDGKGSGLGNYVLNKSMNNIGGKKDYRDYHGATLLLTNHINDNPINLIYSQLNSFDYLKEHLIDNDIKIRRIIYIGKGSQEYGHNIISERIKMCDDIDGLYKSIQIHNFIKYKLSKKYYVTGIGSSEAHAKYLQCYFNANSIFLAEFIPLLQLRNSFIDTSIPLILFSQGLSPNVLPCIEKYDYKNIILFTAVTVNNNNLEKVKILNKLFENDSQIVNYPYEDEYDTLIRIIGPLAGYLAVYKFIMFHTTPFLANEIKINFRKHINSYSIYTPKEYFVSRLIQYKKICIIASYPLKDYIQNIIYKFIEGIFITPLICDYLEFSHGFFQNTLNSNGKFCYILFDSNDNDSEYISKIYKMVDNDNCIWTITSELPALLKIIEFEMKVNYFLKLLINRLNINQKNWNGKDQTILYNF